MIFLPKITGLILAILLAVLSGKALGAAQTTEILVKFESPIVARQGDITISLADVVGYVERRVPVEDRTAVLSNPARLESLLETILLNRHFLSRLSSEGILEDEVVSARLLQAMALESRSIYREMQRDTLELDGYAAQARELYLTEPDRFRLPETIDFRHILVSVNETTNEVEAMKRIIDAFEKLQSGVNFADIASEVSDDPAYVDNEGLYVGMDPTSLLPSVAEAVSVLGLNQWSMPIQSRFGWHLVKVISKNEPKAMTWEEAQPAAEQMARERHLVRAYERTLREMNSAPLQLADGAVASILEYYGLTGFGVSISDESQDP